MREPDFFLTAAGEVMGDLATVRACLAEARLRDAIRDDHMLVEIDPPLIGQAYGLGGQDIAYLILSARFQGSTLFPVKEWPCHVFISRILDSNIMTSLVFAKEQVEIVGWGMIFPTLEDANAQSKEHPDHAF
jgi:hypothetical protein